MQVRWVVNLSLNQRNRQNCFYSAMRAWNRNTLPVAEFICIEFNLFGAMFAEANNQLWLGDRRLPDEWRAVIRINTEIGTTVEVYQNIAWLCAFAGANDATAFEFVHDPCGAGVAESQATLQQ